MKYSTQLWQEIIPIYNAILDLPFNQELMLGTLNPDKFCYYISQDSLYLKDFARCHAMIAARLDSPPLIQTFLEFSKFALIVEQEGVHHYFREKFTCTISEKMSLACLSYTSYLLQVAAFQPVEVIMAAVLPCFWIYQEVGKHIAKHTAANNPYERWISTYAGDEFALTVQKMIDIFDEHAHSTTPAIRQKMREAFKVSAALEWHFWNDAYLQNNYDSCIPPQLTPPSNVRVLPVT